MNITWSAVSVLLILISPAFCLLLLLRLFTLPKARTALPKESTLLLACCVISWVCNLDLLANMAAKLASIAEHTTGLQPWEQSELGMLFTPASSIPHFSLMSLVLRIFTKSTVPDTNVFVFIADLHLRMVMIGLIVLVVGFLISWIEDHCHAYHYWGSGKLLKKVLAARKVAASLADGKIAEQKVLDEHFLSRPWSQYNLPKPNWPLRVFSKSLSIIRDSFYHPWASVTQYNGKRELLIADVLTKEGSLYSGKLVRWIPDDLKLGALGLEYILRYYPTEESAAGPAPKTSWDPPQTPPAKLRKKSLVKNHGELVIPASEIVTVHFWEMRKRFVLEITISKLADIEVLKWYLLLAFSHEHFFDLIMMQVALPKEKQPTFQSELMGWIDENGLASIFDAVLIQVIYLGQSGQAQAQSGTSRP